MTAPRAALNPRRTGRWEHAATPPPAPPPHSQARTHPVVAPTLVTQILRTPAEFAAIEPAWNGLAQRLNTPLMQHAWYLAAINAQPARAADLYIVLVWKGEHLHAAMPLMLDHGQSPARLVPVDAFAGEPDRLLFTDMRGLDALGRACAQLGHPLLLRRLALPEPQVRRFTALLRRRAPVHVAQRFTASTILLPAEFAAFEATMSKNRLNTIRRKIRAIAQAFGGHEAELHTPSPADLPPLLDRVEQVENAGWKGRAGTSLRADPQMRRFISEVAHAYARAGRLRVIILRLGQFDAACRLILQNSGSWGGIKIGYDESYARYSPGILLMHETLRLACENGVARYCFLGVSEDWQAHWPHDRRPDFRVASYPLSMAGLRALFVDAWRAGRLLLTRR